MRHYQNFIYQKDKNIVAADSRDPVAMPVNGLLFNAIRCVVNPKSTAELKHEVTEVRKTLAAMVLD
ncbi:hypothetical protein KXD40_003452 [Peronospora effusa]|uniref:Uncharacterized protein n=1 Tax=Peronospora effusa TaxID=542832 RepID=A0A3M6VNX8_9STRA|nr:hypothetical protein DD238_008454 [Peronospora effusa]RQM09265.1 hypothetical protein DD237_008578 [Peronospora effusa]UIZ23044.1 hypothetical protein KXD40_003452 [Peronospora effusa]